MMMKKYLILLAGPPATGKSYLSRLICQALPETYTVSPDELKENLADNIGYNTLEEKVELEKVVWDYYYQALELYMKIGKQFILTEQIYQRRFIRTVISMKFIKISKKF